MRLFWTRVRGWPLRTWDGGRLLCVRADLPLLPISFAHAAAGSCGGHDECKCNNVCERQWILRNRYYTLGQVESPRPRDPSFTWSPRLPCQVLYVLRCTELCTDTGYGKVWGQVQGRRTRPDHRSRQCCGALQGR
ncbi:hypothetical protein LX36DRAFT_359793 [Colletotrichum falcatum]|nr:hypothetical protein LX36DRAFT_359793 [Colletotrichum falcatum]